MRATRSWWSLNTTAGPTWSSSLTSAAERLSTARRERSLEDDERAARVHRVVEAADDVGVEDARAFHVLAQRASVDRPARQVEPGADDVEHRHQAAGEVQVLHEVLAGRHQVADHRHELARVSKRIERELVAEPARHRDQVDERVRRSRD